jgi:hypothetical protein
MSLSLRELQRGRKPLSSPDDATHRIAVLGRCMVDLVARIPRLPVPGETLFARSFDVFVGGKGGNQSIAAKRLGAEHPPPHRRSSRSACVFSKPLFRFGRLTCYQRTLNTGPDQQ